MRKCVRRKNKIGHTTRHFFRHPAVVISFGVLLLLSLLCILAPVLAPHDPNLVDPLSKFSGMSAAHPMGTDYLGRDIFSRVLWGGRRTIGCALLVTAASSCAGTCIGMVCAMSGGIADSIIMKGSDVLRAFPGIVLVLIMVSILGVGIENVCLAMLLTRWIWYARVSRNLARAELARTSVMASRLAGSSWLKILKRNIFPAIMPQMLAVLSIDFGGALLAISGYSFLGLGILPPDPEWGMMISDGRSYMEHPGMMFWPGICVLAVVISANLLGDKLRDTLEEIHT